MKTEPHNQIPELSEPAQTDHQTFHRIIDDLDNLKSKASSGPVTDDEDRSKKIINLHFQIHGINNFSQQIRRADKKYRAFAHDRRSYWINIAAALSTPEVKEATRKLFPQTDGDQLFLTRRSAVSSPSQSRTSSDNGHISTRRPFAPRHQITPRPAPTPRKYFRHKKGTLWKHEPRWDHLWKSSQTVFTETARRTQIPKRADAFPWGQIGVKSLARFTGLSEKQVKRALRQLEQYKLIKRIVRAYQGQLPSKYLVFLTPAQSAAYAWKSRHGQKPRIS